MVGRLFYGGVQSTVQANGHVPCALPIRHGRGVTVVGVASRFQESSTWIGGWVLPNSPLDLLFNTVFSLLLLYEISKLQLPTDDSTPPDFCWPKLLRLARPSICSPKARFSTRRLPSAKPPPTLQIAPAPSQKRRGNVELTQQCIFHLPRASLLPASDPPPCVTSTEIAPLLAARFLLPRTRPIAYAIQGPSTRKYSSPTPYITTPQWLLQRPNL